MENFSRNSPDPKEESPASGPVAASHLEIPAASRPELPEVSAEETSRSANRIVIGVVVLIGLAGGYWLLNRNSGTPPPALQSAAAPASPTDAVKATEAAVKATSTAENYLTLSLEIGRAHV